ncbi:MAG: hypothetical protein WA982_13615 [Rubrobacteraceae bacterium]
MNRVPDVIEGEAGRMPVIATLYRCGCVTSHTPAGYLTEAVFCPEALTIERERLVLQRVQRKTELEDPRMDELIPALEEREAALEAHRRGAGIAETVDRMSDPDLLPGEVPVAAPANFATKKATKKGVPS